MRKTVIEAIVDGSVTLEQLVELNEKGWEFTIEGGVITSFAEAK